MSEKLTASVRAFRGMRFVPSRVEMASVILPAKSGDPRHVLQLLDDTAQSDDGKDAAVRRARFRLAEWQRAGVVARDAQPALYALRRRDEDGTEALGLFCAVGLSGGENALPTDPKREARFDGVGVGVEPVVAAFEEARVRRALENAVDREADASWKIGRVGYELWCVDEESTTARIGNLLSQTPLTVSQNAEVLAAQGAWWSRQRKGEGDDDRLRAGAFALAFLHPADEAWPEVPVGAAMAPLTGWLA